MKKTNILRSFLTLLAICNLQIISTCYAQYAPGDDFDGDGIINSNDIDDDNDGVPDAVEAPLCFYTAAEANVITTITSALLSPDDNQTDGDIQLLHDAALTTYTFNFAAGQAINGAALFIIKYPTPVALTSMTINNNTTFGAGTTARLQGSTDSSTWVDASASVALSTTANKVFTSNNSNTYQYYRILGDGGAVNTVTATTIGEITSIISAGYVPSAHSKPTCTTDTDGDGIANNFDLDSDGDGCSDAREAGATASTTVNFQFPGPYGANGLENTLETVADNGVTNYTSAYDVYATDNKLNYCTDTDNDGVPDITDMDDDNDGIPDRTECPTLANMAAGGGFSNAANTISNWYVATTSAVLPIASPVTPAAFSFSGRTPVYNYGGQPTYSGNSTITGGLFDRVDGINTATGVQFAMQEGDPQHPVVCQLSVPLVSGAEYSFAFDLGARTNNPSTNKYVVLLYNATTGMTEQIIASDILSSLPGPGSSPAYKTVSGTFIPNSSANYYLLFYPTISGGGSDDFTIDRVAVQTNSINACDTDGDGIPNYLDLDSDNDGCSDALEGGATTNTTANFQFTGAVGTNGLIDSKETATDNGIINYYSTYNTNALSRFLATCADADGDGILDVYDIDDDNDGIPDADECPTCYYTAAEAGVVAKVFTGLASSTVNSAAVSMGADIPSLRDGTSTSVGAGNHVVAAGQTTTTSSVIYRLDYPTLVRLSSVSVIGATASWGTGSFAVLEGSTDGTNFNDALSAPLATSAGATKTWTVTLNTSNYYQYYRIRVSTIGSTTPTFTNYEVSSVLNTTGYIPSAHPKTSCATDTDGDGITNDKDTDSDGDGCSDALEAGATTDNTANYQFTGDVGINGLVNAIETVADNGIINYTSTYAQYAIANNLSICADTDGDGVPDVTDTDDDNDGILDAAECPACYYTPAEAGALASVSTGLASSTVSSVAVSPGNDIPTMHDGTSISAGTGNHVVASAQTNSTASVIYILKYPTPVKLTSVSVVGATASWGTGSFAVLEGSADGITFSDALSAPLATSAGATKTWTVTLNTANYYQYYRIRVSTVGSTTPTFTNYEVTAVQNTTGYIPSAHPKPSCTTDTDGDGVLNNLDLDSDGDMCPDAIEAGVFQTSGGPAMGNGTLRNGSGGSVSSTQLVSNATVAAPYNANGFANSVETAPGSNVYNSSYTYSLAVDGITSVNCANSVVLPLRWLDVQARAQAQEVEVIWLAGSEESIRYYEVYRSADGSHFMAVGRVTALNNQAATNNYTYIDRDAVSQDAATLYYYVVAINLDGSRDRSKTVSVKWADRNSSAITLYPNPAGSEVYFSSLKDVQSISFYNAAGVIVKQFQHINAVNRRYDITGLSNGHYMVRLVKKNGEPVQLRLIVVK